MNIPRFTTSYLHSTDQMFLVLVGKSINFYPFTNAASYDEFSPPQAGYRIIIPIPVGDPFGHG